jgi:hypothetical protein
MYLVIYQLHSRLCATPGHILHKNDSLVRGDVNDKLKVLYKQVMQLLNSNIQHGILLKLLFIHTTSPCRSASRVS